MEFFCYAQSRKVMNFILFRESWSGQKINNILNIDPIKQIEREKIE